MNAGKNAELAFARVICLTLSCSLLVTQCLAQEDSTPEIAGDIDRENSLLAKADAVRTEQTQIGKELSARFPDDFHTLRVMGYVHSSHGNQEEMFRCWTKCQELKPNRADILDQLGRHCAKIEQYDEAINYWQQALELDAEFPGLRRRIGSVFLNQGNPESARTSLQAAVARNARDSEAFFLLGESLYQLGDFQKAKESYESALKLNPNYAKCHYGLVKTCGRLRDRESAAKHAKLFKQFETAAAKADREYRRRFDDLKQMTDELVVTCIDAGNVYRRENDLAKAETLWSRAAELDPRHIKSRLLLATHHSQVGEPAKAIRRLVELAKLQPKKHIPSSQDRFSFRQPEATCQRPNLRSSACWRSIPTEQRGCARWLNFT